MSKIKEYIRTKFDFPSFIRHIILSWLIAVAIEYFKLPKELRKLSSLNGLAQMSFTRVIVITVCLAVVFSVISCFIKTANVERRGIVIVFAIIAVGTLGTSISTSYLAMCVFIIAILVIFCWFGWKKSDEQTRIKNLCLRITILLSVVFFLFVTAWTVGRVYSFSSPTFDFGIFSQMFYNMKETGLPLTTVERDGLLSHFAVHVSPIYYLMLPFYWLFPVPATLQVLQALVITSAIIPLWKIGEQHGLSDVQKMLSCVLLLLYPAFSGGTGYDIHENCFLTPLIFWALYGIDKKNTVITAIGGVLILMVKEDSAVYVATIALWLILKTILHSEKINRKDLFTGIIMLVVSLCWFSAVTTYLTDSGDGVMTYRYDNLMYEESTSLITVIKSIILNPMKAIYECADSEKTEFIAITIIPLLGIPLITRRYERYILLIPYILVNLMSDYYYQHNIFFQYTFGSTALLVYLTVINLADFKVNRKRILILAVATIISASYFYTVVLPVGIQNPVQAIQKQEHYQDICDTLDFIPDDSSVAATTFFTTYLSQREILYDVRYCSESHLLESEYIVLEVNSNDDCSKYATNGMKNGYNNLVKLLEENGYQMYVYMDNVLVIYQKTFEP